VRAAIEALYATGHYSYVEVDATATPEGTQLTFNVKPHYFFSTVRLEQRDLLERTLASTLRIPVGEKFSTARVRNMISESTALLEEEGYFNAVITPEYVPDESTRLMTVNLTTPITKESRARIGTVKIIGGEATFPPEAGELQDAFGLSKGDRFSADALARGTSEILRKFAELRFLNNKVNAQRDYDPVRNIVNLTVTVQPGQLVYVSARGHEISDERLRELVPVYEEGAIDQDLLREGRARIAEHLQQEGYFEATVAEPEVIRAPFDNAVQVNFTITPGERHEIGTVQIRGNAFFAEEELLARMKIRGAGLLDRGIFSPALLKADIAAIEAMYRRAGFEEVRVLSSQGNGVGHTLNIVIDIEEGSRYVIERLIFSGNVALSEDELRGHLTLKEGAIYSPAEATTAVNTLMSAYYSKGYPDVRIAAAADRNPVTGAKSITFQISEGRSYRIGSIIVAGNTRTADKIVRNSSGLREYEDEYNPEAILEAQQRLYATGLFNRVDIVPLDQDNGPYRTLLIQVEDARPILVTPGVGVKEYTGPRATLEISHNNLFGLDRSLNMRLRLGVLERQLQTTYREPRLFNHPRLEGYATFSIEKSDLPFYEARSLDFAIQVLKHLSPNSSFVATASYETINLQDIKVNPAARRFPDLQGIIQIASFGARFDGDWRKAADGRSDSINPEKGSSTTSTVQVANRAWGSEVNFVALFNQYTYFKPVPSGIMAFSSRIGWKKPYGDDQELPISERYFAGGSTTLRGYDLDEAGPPGGGQLMTIWNVEYRVPLQFVPRRLGRFGGALFYDTGTVFERTVDFSLSEFTHTAGAGLRYQTPLGPVRFDVGINLRPKLLLLESGSSVREERVQVFFTLGHTF
jgi:outer membrane protein assembly complex protein YaeT